MWHAWVAIRPLVVAALAGAFVTFLLMGGLRMSTSSAPGQNIAAGMIDAVRVGDPNACTMATPAAAREIARMLGSSSDCQVAVARSSAQARAQAMRPFLGIVGLAVDSTGGGSSAVGSREVDWSQLHDGRYAVMRVSSHGAEGYLVDAIRLQARCGDCS